MAEDTGTISQVIGPVVDVRFDTEKTTLPNIYDALKVEKSDGNVVILECQQHTWRRHSTDYCNGFDRWFQPRDASAGYGSSNQYACGRRNKRQII